MFWISRLNLLNQASLVRIYLIQGKIHKTRYESKVEASYEITEHSNFPLLALWKFVSESCNYSIKFSIQ